MAYLVSVVEYSKRYSCGKFGSVSNTQETVDNFVDNLLFGESTVVAEFFQACPENYEQAVDN